MYGSSETHILQFLVYLKKVNFGLVFSIVPGLHNVVFSVDTLTVPVKQTTCEIHVC